MGRFLKLHGTALLIAAVLALSQLVHLSSADPDDGVDNYTCYYPSSDGRTILESAFQFTNLPALPIRSVALNYDSGSFSDPTALDCSVVVSTKPLSEWGLSPTDWLSADWMPPRQEANGPHFALRRLTHGPDLNFAFVRCSTDLVLAEGTLAPNMTLIYDDVSQASSSFAPLQNTMSPCIPFDGITVGRTYSGTHIPIAAVANLITAGTGSEESGFLAVHANFTADEDYVHGVRLMGSPAFLKHIGDVYWNIRVPKVFASVPASEINYERLDACTGYYAFPRENASGTYYDTGCGPVDTITCLDYTGERVLQKFELVCAFDTYGSRDSSCLPEFINGTLSLNDYRPSSDWRLLSFDFTYTPPTRQAAFVRRVYTVEVFIPLPLTQLSISGCLLASGALPYPQCSVVAPRPGQPQSGARVRVVLAAAHIGGETETVQIDVSSNTEFTGPLTFVGDIISEDFGTAQSYLTGAPLTLGPQEVSLRVRDQTEEVQASVVQFRGIHAMVAFPLAPMPAFAPLSAAAAAVSTNKGSFSEFTAQSIVIGGLTGLIPLGTPETWYASLRYWNVTKDEFDPDEFEGEDDDDDIFACTIYPTGRFASGRNPSGDDDFVRMAPQDHPAVHDWAPLMGISCRLPKPLPPHAQYSLNVHDRQNRAIVATGSVPASIDFSGPSCARATFPLTVETFSGAPGTLPADGGPAEEAARARISEFFDALVLSHRDGEVFYAVQGRTATVRACPARAPDTNTIPREKEVLDAALGGITAAALSGQVLPAFYDMVVMRAYQSSDNPSDWDEVVIVDMDPENADKKSLRVVPAADVDYKCAVSQSTTEATRDACVLQVCSRDLVTPVFCYYDDFAAPVPECANYRQLPKPQIHGCSFPIADIAYTTRASADTSAPRDVEIDFQVIPGEGGDDWSVIDSLSVSFVPSTPITPVTYEIFHLYVNGSMSQSFDSTAVVSSEGVKVTLTNDFRSRYRLILRGVAASEAESTAKALLFSVRSVQYLDQDIFSSESFSSVVATDHEITPPAAAGAVNVAGSHRLFAAYKAGSLAHASAATIVVATDFEAAHCSLAPVVTPAGSDLFTPTWPTAAFTDYTLNPVTQTAISTLPVASLSVDLPAPQTDPASMHLLCTGSWPAGQPSSDTPQSTLLGTRVAGDALLYGVTVSSLRVHSEPRRFAVASVPVTLAQPIAATADAVAALVPAWLAPEGKATAVSAPEGSDSAVAFHLSEFALEYLPRVPTLSAVLLSQARATVTSTGPSDEVITLHTPGEWLCGDLSLESFAQCEAANACAVDYSQPQFCVSESSSIAKASINAQISCAFADAPAPLPESQGCGVFLCLAASTVPGENSTFVPCDDATVCAAGCAQGVQLTPELIATAPALAPVCVKNNTAVDADAFCPTGLVDAPEYASECDATSTCGLICTNSGAASGAAPGPVRAECEGESAWSACSGDCVAGTQHIDYRCADTTASIGGAAPVAVPADFCPGGSDWASQGPGFPTERVCEATVCSRVIVTVVPTPDAPGDFTIRWTIPDAAAGTAATLALTPVPSPALTTADQADTVELGAAPVGASSFDVDGQAAGVAEGEYTATVTYTADLEGESDSFPIGYACTPTSCHNGGVCDAETGVCACVGDWAGRHCQISPCDTSGLACNPTGGACVVSPAGKAYCECVKDSATEEPLFQGPLCLTPTNGCAESLPECDNGGVRGGELIPPATQPVCTDCVCEAGWSPASNCAECGYSCLNGGAVDDACTSCQCPANGGYHGDHCECRYVYLTFAVAEDKLPAGIITGGGDEPIVVDSDALAHFASAFAADVMAAVGALQLAAEVSATAHVTTGPKKIKYYSVRLAVGPSCAAVSGSVPDSAMADTYSGISAVKGVFDALGHTSYPALALMHLDAGFDAHDPNCRLGTRCPSGWRNKGVVPDKNGDGTDEGGETPVDKTDGDGLSLGAIVGIAVGGSFALLIIIRVVVAFAKGALCFAKANSASGAVEMTSV